MNSAKATLSPAPREEQPHVPVEVWANGLEGSFAEKPREAWVTPR